MIIVKCGNKRIEWALKEYRKKVDSTGQITDLRERREFEKPCVKRRKEIQRAKYRQKNGNTKF